MSIPKDLINKESPLSNKDLDFLNEIKPDTSVQKEPDLNNDKSIEEVDLINAENQNPDKESDSEILLAGVFPKNFKIKKKTYKDKNAEDLTNKQLGDQQQEQLKTKTEGEDFKFEEGTGKAVFADFTDEQMESINQTLIKFGAGELDQTKRRSLKFIFDEMDADIKNSKLLDSNKFSDFVTKFIPSAKKVTIRFNG